ncbi:MAG: imidazolonepropionase [Acidobacteriota bacterium]
MPVLRNIGQLATCPMEGDQAEVCPIEQAALVWKDGLVAWAGRETDLPPQFEQLESRDAGGRLVIPGLVDCHTHLGFGGWRADEFEMRLRGRDYLEIARAGGGIASTVLHTRQIGVPRLLAKCMTFLREMAALGVTSVECKSGYGLDLENEIKLLETYRQLRQQQPLRILSTFLGAHTVPLEYRQDRAGYVELLVSRMIPVVAGRQLADFCDVFLEESAFSRAEARQILEVGKKWGLRPKLHADQLSSCGGAELAAELGAASADHLECISTEGIAALAKSEVVAVSLPLASLYLEKRPLPARKLIESGVKVAVATDFNPGSAPSYHLPLAMTLACTAQRMTPAEVLKGSTIYAAKAIGTEDRVGSLEVGKEADFCLIDAPSINHWLYHFRPNACLESYVGGIRCDPSQFPISAQ